MRLHKDFVVLFGSAAAAIALAPLLVQGNAQTNARRAAAQQQIEILSPAERQRLDENLKRFEALSPSDRQKYREIHDQVEQNPKVADALATFADWWPTVSAQDQGELFRQSDVAGRVAVVERIQEHIDDDRIQQVYGRGGDYRGRDVKLERESFYRVMEKLEAIASEGYLIPDAMVEIQKLPPNSPQRALKLVTALHEKGKTWQSVVSNAALENQIYSALPVDPFKELRNRLGERFTSFRSGAIRTALFYSLGKEFYLEALKRNPGDAEIGKMLAALPEAEQETLYSYSADEARARLKAKFFQDLKDSMSPAWDFFQPVYFGRGGGGGGRDGGFRGNDGPRGEGPRPDGGRPDGGRPPERQEPPRP